MIFLQQLSLAYGPKVILRDISLAFSPGDRMGLVGSNGAGKTTLLRILCGQEDPDSGRVEFASGVRVGYLPQDGISCHGTDLLTECRQAFPEILDRRRQLSELESRLKVLSSEKALPVLEAIDHCEQELHLAGADEMEARIERILGGLGFERADFTKQTDTFSGGWQMRIALAKLLLSQPDLLLLDEPTNHLDLEAQQWIEGFLKNYAGAFLVISHDRGFLDAVTNRTLHLHHGQLDDYRKSYSGFEEEAAARKELLLKSSVKQQREIQRIESFVDRFRYKASKARQVQSRIKALAKIDQIEIGEEEDSIQFSFPDPGRGPQRVAAISGVRKAYGDLQVLRDLDFRLERGEKVAIVGRNGRGKSTFARILAGVEAPDAGFVSHGEGIRVGWFAQHQTQTLDVNQTVMECAEEVCETPEDRRQVRSILGAFLFRGDDVKKKVQVLSGGEKNRLALVRILLGRANLLILDEPTNHLDLASKTVLQGALMDYSGAVVIIAHDRDFLDPIVDRVFAFEPEGTRPFAGNVSEYLEDWQKRYGDLMATLVVNAKTVAPKGDAGAGEPRQDGKARRREAAEKRQRLAPLKKELEALEKQIASLEELIATLEKSLADPEFFQKPEAVADIRRHRDSQEKLEQLMKRWEVLSAEIEAAGEGMA